MLHVLFATISIIFQFKCHPNVNYASDNISLALEVYYYTSASVWDAIVQTSHAHLLLATLQFLIESFIFRLKFLLHTVLLLNAIAILYYFMTML